ncbi:MAG: methylamine utilization protein mauG [Candidatus Thioglobus sp.]|nr:MAG: methylamine utilization protein mauG [Candidatus Thioglobus sp.]
MQTKNNIFTKMSVKQSLIIPALLVLATTASGLALAITEKAKLGKQLFNDASLSKDGTQSCATCHDKEQAFIDTRNNITSYNNAPAAVALGQDGKSFGDINVPSIAYAALMPEFYFNKEEGLFMGGLFLNGRAKNLVEQAKQPFLNPVEMQTNAVQVVKKVQKKYAQTMQKLYGKDIFSDSEKAFDAIAESITEFEKTAQFSPFNAKFDAFLQGKVQLSELELLGKKIFEDEEKGNCAACHPVPTLKNTAQESLFTDFSYDNLGVPVNTEVRKLNGKGADFVDNGLFDNPMVNDVNLKGAFKVVSLRNGCTF